MKCTCGSIWVFFFLTVFPSSLNFIFHPTHSHTGLFPCIFIIRITRRPVSFNRSNRTLSNWNENKIEKLHFLCTFAGNPCERKKRKCSSWFLQIYASICKMVQCDVSVKRAAHKQFPNKQTKKANCLAKQMDLKIGKEFPIKWSAGKKCAMLNAKQEKQREKCNPLFSHNSTKFDCCWFCSYMWWWIQHSVLHESKLPAKNISLAVAMAMYGM